MTSDVVGQDHREPWLARHPLAVFVVSAFGLTWGIALPQVAAARGLSEGRLGRSPGERAQ